jgi:hypothetical protein
MLLRVPELLPRILLLSVAPPSATDDRAQQQHRSDHLAHLRTRHAWASPRRRARACSPQSFVLLARSARALALARLGPLAQRHDRVGQLEQLGGSRGDGTWKWREQDRGTASGAQRECLWLGVQSRRALQTLLPFRRARSQRRSDGDASGASTSRHEGGICQCGRPRHPRRGGWHCDGSIGTLG